MSFYRNCSTKKQIMVGIVLSGAIEAMAGEAGSISTNPPPPQPTISNMLMVKVEGGRVLNDSFEYTAVFEVKKTEVLESLYENEILADPGSDRKGVFFKISYNSRQKDGPTEEIVTFGDNAMFDKLFQDLYSKEPDTLEKGASPQKKRRLAYDFSNIDYYEAVLDTVTRLTENEGQIPCSLINLLIENGIDKEKFVTGFSDSIRYTEKELKRKREEEEESDITIRSKFGNYISYLNGLGDFRSQCEVLVNGDEGVFSMELTMQNLDEKMKASPLPQSVLDFHKNLKNWAVGKIFTLFNKKLQAIREKGKNHSVMFN
ncbi:MAG: hypothetical protein K0M45_02635 [Candidatus Paracaedibacteraceae bacterium]|nr:hypothetical protein [Candidatus Paracaedibacteraceae bacterium]